MQPNTPKIRRKQLLLQELPDEVLIYDLERNKAHCLNGSAARVWAFCDGERTVPQIARLAAPDLEPSTAETLVWCALDQFAERHLLEDQLDRPLEMTRRQMVLRLGLIVGLALPVVESIVSPPAALAGSQGCSGSTQGTPGTTPCTPP